MSLLSTCGATVARCCAARVADHPKSNPKQPMKSQNLILVFPVLLCCWSATAAEGGGSRPAPIQSVEIRDRVFHVNGKPFFPLMAWLQDAGNFPKLKACAMNATAGYFRGSSGTRDVSEYVALVEEAGLYGVMPYDARLKDHPALLGYIHDDEPDLPRLVSDAVVKPGPNLRLNSKTPLWKLLDGDISSWSVLDPMAGAQLTVRLPQRVTVAGFGIAVTVSRGLALPTEVVFSTGDQELWRAKLKAERGVQKFTLPEPVSFQELSLQVVSTAPGEQVWGSLGEIEAYDSEGRNVLLSRPRQVPRALPDATLRAYQAVKAGDATRPLFMTLTGNFHPFFKKYDDEQRAMYPRYIEAADVVGYDIYPIYGWNKPEWLHLVHEATDLLVRLSGPRPVYAWIETSKGGQWTGALERQKEVTPEHIRAEVWMCICRGATAIGYFTHVWKPQYAQFGVPEENQRALQEINGQITRLAPVILGQPASPAVAIQSADGVKLDLLARESDGALYLFAVNYDERARETVATLRVGGLKAGTRVGVVDEDRSIQAQAEMFTDTFAPLAVHIYRLDLP